MSELEGFIGELNGAKRELAALWIQFKAVENGLSALTKTVVDRGQEIIALKEKLRVQGEVLSAHGKELVSLKAGMDSILVQIKPPQKPTQMQPKYKLWPPFTRN